MAIKKLMEVVCHLHLVTPEWDTTSVAMLKNSEQNSLNGDEDAMVYVYDVKILHLIDIYDVYKICKYEKTLRTIGEYCYDPAFSDKNVHFMNVGRAATSLVSEALLRRSTVCCAHCGFFIAG